MTDPCRDWRGALAAAALGRSDPAEEIGLRAHLDGCASCRAELRDLTAVAQALATVPVENITSAPTAPPSALAGRVLERVARERNVRRGRRTRRFAAGTAAFVGAAAAVIAAVILVGSLGSSSGTHVPLRGAGGASATATLHGEAYGTEIELTVAQLHPGHYYWLWLTGDDGHRIPAGTFTGADDATKLKMLAALPLQEARRIWVTDDRRRVVLDGRLPS